MMDGWMMDHILALKEFSNSAIFSFSGLHLVTSVFKAD